MKNQKTKKGQSSGQVLTSLSRCANQPTKLRTGRKQAARAQLAGGHASRFGGRATSTIQNPSQETAA